jgi:hypothetical protein
VIPNLINPIPCVTARLGLIGIGGFPHSEIVGSMLAHSSPTLIAACHVLHRLYMPRHPRIALTSRLRVHTTNDITGCLQRRSPTRQSSASWSLSGADDYNLSQIILYDDVDIRSLEPLAWLADAEALTNRRSNPRPQNRAPHGIDFKKPIHNVKYGSSRPNHRALARRTVSLHHLDMWFASSRPLAPVSRS